MTYSEEVKTVERVTLNLSNKSAKAVRYAMEVSGDNKTVAINKATQIYAQILEMQEEKTPLYYDKDGTLIRIQWF